NSSQMSDGAGAVLLASEQAIKDYGLTPLARFVSFSVAGVRPEVMGIGPIAAIPKALRQAGLTRDQLDWIELNEAFAAQALAVIRDSELDPDKVNPLGGAIALGHPLGATGAIRTATIVHGMRRRKHKYGMVTMCIGTGMGAAGIFEALWPSRPPCRGETAPPGAPFALVPDARRPVSRVPAHRAAPGSAASFWSPPARLQAACFRVRASPASPARSRSRQRPVTPRP